MFRYILSALAGAMLVVCQAVAEPSLEKMQEAARWSVQLQGALQEIVGQMALMDEYVLTVEGVIDGQLSPEAGAQKITGLTSQLDRGLVHYVSALEAMPPHPMASHPLGIAGLETRDQLIAQADLISETVDRVEALSLEAIKGDGDAINRLGGQLFRTSALLLGTDIALMRTQLAALDEDNPVRNLNLAGIGQMQFSREITMFAATRMFGSSPGFSDGDLDAAGGYITSARLEVNKGRRNAARMRSLLIQEKAEMGPQSHALYDNLITMTDTFAADWTDLDTVLSDAEYLLTLARNDDPSFGGRFDAYMVSMSKFGEVAMGRQLERSRLVSQ